MPLTIATNVSSLTATRNASASESALARSLQRLSSGLRVNSAADDAAGLAIAGRMTTQIRGADQSKRNVNDSISLLQVADGVMANVVTSLQRLRELAVQAGNATNSATDRAALQQEAGQLIAGITASASQASFNGQPLFSSSVASIGGDPDKRLLLDRLRIGWYDEAEKRIETYYGLEADGASLNVDVDGFTDGPFNVLAFVQGLVNGDGTLGNLRMAFDMQDFAPPNTSSDRVVAHELTHAVMMRTMNFASLPQWFVEGTAELIPGADERLAGAVAGIGAAAVVASVGGGFSYEGSYVASRYLHDRLKALCVDGGIKGLMQYLDNNQAATLDTVLNAVTGGVYANTAAFVADFSANGVNFITTKMNLTNADTGGIGGLDADGGPVLTSAGVISDTNQYAEVLDAFAENFPTLGGTTGTKSYLMQIGEKVGDTMSVDLAAMNASALGLDGFDLQGLSGFNILHVDQALDFVLEQRANVGASISRLDSVSNTLTAQSENLSASRSRIADADYAVETASLTKAMILQRSAIAIVAQANATPQMVLSLLK
jgi:flagellin